MKGHIYICTYICIYICISTVGRKMLMKDVDSNKIGSEVKVA